MRNNTKKGFTLVELLVVIAILAILATVSVVGYTSFIEGSAVKVDADFATQLNHFLAAYKVNNKVTINEDNIDKVTADILDLAGVDEIEPQAGQYGYHFYYDFKDEQYKSLHDDVAITGTKSPVEQIAMHVLGYEPANGTSYKVRPGNCFTFNGQYYLVDGVGDLADVVSGIVNFNGTTTDLTNLEKAAQETGYENLVNFVRSTVFVTKKGSLVLSTSGSRSYVIIADDVETIKGEIVDVAGNKLPLSDTTYLATTADGFSMYVPETVTNIEGNALNINTPADCTILYLPAGTDVAAVCEAGFTNPNVIIMVGNVRYKLANSSDLVNTETNMTTTLKVKSVVKDFDLVINDTNNDNIDTYQQEGYKNNIGYVAWNNGNFLLQVDASQVLSTDGTNKVSTYEMYWELVTEGLGEYIYISNGEDGNPAGTVVFNDYDKSGAVDSADYVKFLEHLNTLVADGKTYFTVKATSVYSVTGEGDEQIVEKVEDGDYTNCPSVTMDVRVLTITEVGEVKIKDAANGWTSSNPVVLPYTEIGQTFDIVAGDLTYNWDGEIFNVDLACSVELKYECLHKTGECCMHVQCAELTAANILTHHNADCLECTHKAGVASTHTDDCCGHEHDEDCCTHTHSKYCSNLKNADGTAHTHTSASCCSGGHKNILGKDTACSGYGTLDNCNLNKCSAATNGTCDHQNKNQHSESCCQHLKQIHDLYCTNCNHEHVDHFNNGGKTPCCDSNHMSQGQCESALRNCCTHYQEIHKAYCCEHLTSGYEHNENCLTCTHVHNAAKCDKISCGYSELGTSIISGNVITIPENTNLNQLSGKLSVYVEGKDWGYVNLTFVNFSESSFKPSSSLSTHQNVYVGNDGGIKVSDLFSFVGETFNPDAGYKLVIFTRDVDNNNYDNLNYGKEAERHEFDITSVDQLIDLSTVATSTVKPYRAVMFMNGTRITEDMILRVENAKNVHTWEEFKALVSGDTNALANSVVLFGDIAIPADDAVDFFTLKDKAIYGNCFTFDVQNGRTVSDIICLEGASLLRDLKLTGALYKDFALQKTDEWGSSVVRAEGTSSIINCYISNTRSPLYVGGTKVTVKDTVLYGGRFANIDHRGGELVFEGTVTLIQKPIEYQIVGDYVKGKVIGFGIATWFNDGAAKVVTLATDAKLIQYNFISEELKNDLPKIAGMVSLTEPFDEAFNNPEYQSYIYKDGNTKYLNSGIVATDAYRIDYRVESPRGEKTEYKTGDILTLKLNPNNTTGIDANNTEKFTITFLPDHFKPQNFKADGNKLVVEGKDLYNGIKFELLQDVTLTSLPNVDLGNVELDLVADWLVYSFRIDCPDNYKNLQTSSNIKYEGFIFDSEQDYKGIFGIAGQTFHNAGLHYGQIVMDVRTPVGYDDQFEQYLTYVMDGAYDPDGENAYDFVNGNLVIYGVTDVE